LGTGIYRWGGGLCACLFVCMWMIGWIFNKTGDVKFPIRAKKLIKTDNNKNKPESVPEDKFELTIDDSDRYE
jgi:hypothetical protein